MTALLHSSGINERPVFKPQKLATTFMTHVSGDVKPRWTQGPANSVW